MNLFSLPTFITSFLIFILGLTIYCKGEKNKVNIIFFFLSASITTWLFFVSIAYNFTNYNKADIYMRICYLGISFIPVSTSHFIIEFLKIRISKYIIVVLYLIGAIFGYLMLFSNYFLIGVKVFFWGFYPRAGIFHPFFLFFLFGNALTMTFLLIREYLKVYTSALRRNQIKYILIAFLFLAASTVDFIPVYGVNLYPFGYIPVTVFLIIIAYSTIKYRVLDITIAITRTGIFIAVYSLVLGIPFIIAYGLQARLIAIFGNQWWIVPLISSTVLATAGPFIYLYIQKRAENRLLREQRAYQTTLRQASTGMNRIRDLQKLLNLIVHVVTRTVHLKNGAVYLFDENKNSYILQAARDQGKAKLGMTIPAKSSLIQKLLVDKEALVYEEIKQRLQDYQDSSLAEVEAQMKQIDAAVVVPSFAGEGLVGFIVLGEKLSGKLYSQDDLVVFGVLANQAALAIENARFYEDVKKTQEQLFQAEKMATIGTMANGLSHQISNRLQALGFIAGDTLDTLKMAWDKPYPQDIKDLLETIKHALERVQDNVKQGGEVVKGMLKYSRPGEAGFEPIKLDDLITASLEMAQYKVKLSYLDIIREFSKDLPPIRGNFTQLQEVFFNLIDNAYDATVQCKEELQEPDYKGKITISASVQESTLQIRFKDNGIGVKREDFSKIFTPFFTTKTSSKKGTGLGLYVIQKIIASHNGEIHIESRYREGTMFIIELPLSRA